jgi:hypothetical protein
VPPEPKVVDLKGQVHWPTNLNSHKPDNVIQPLEMKKPPVYSDAVATAESLGVVKPIRKLVAPITPNTEPVARPTMTISKLPAIFRKAVRRHVKNNRTRKAYAKGSAKSQARHMKKRHLLKTRRK